jgi:membrane fusion protein (multidrug efflux system)
MRAASSLCLLLTVSGLALGAGCGKKEPPPPPPPTVLVATAEKKDITLQSEYVGALDGYVNVDIRARVPGFLRSQDYVEGSVVREGQLMFTIDPRDYQARLNESKAALARANANLQIADVSVRRLRPLAAQRAVSQQDLDNAVANERSMKAAVDAAQADVEQAALNLSYTKVTTPLSGIAGTAQVRVGNLVGQGQPTLLATVSSVDPIRVHFNVTESDYLLARAQRPGLAPREVPTAVAQGAAKKAAAGAPVPPPTETSTGIAVKLVLSDGTTYPYPGQLLFAERNVDPRTGTLAVTAVFPNPKKLLRPGQAGRVRLGFQQIKGAVLVPQSAVNQLEGLFRVAVVGQDGVAHIKPVKVGPTYGTRFVIQSGVDGGEQVITDGFAKVKEGAKVNTKPAPPASQGGDGGAAADGGGAADGGAGGAADASQPNQANPATH